MLSCEGKWARLRELSETGSWRVGGGGAGPRGQRRWEGRGVGAWPAVASMSLFLNYNAGKETIRTEKECNYFERGVGVGWYCQGFKARDATAEKAFAK